MGWEGYPDPTYPKLSGPLRYQPLPPEPSAVDRLAAVTDSAAALRVAEYDRLVAQQEQRESLIGGYVKKWSKVLRVQEGEV